MSLINREDVLALIPKHVSPAMASDLADAIAALPAQVGEPVGTVVAIAGDLRELRVIEWRNAAPAVGTPLYASPPPDRPCPHVRTSRGGTSYCELAQAGRPVPEGWKVVPVEPTDDMVDAGQSAKRGADDEDRVCNIYHAMLAAAPGEEKP